MAVDVTNKIKQGTATGTSGALALPEREVDEPGGDYSWMLVQNLSSDVIHVREDGTAAVADADGNVAILPGMPAIFALPQDATAPKIIASGTSSRYQTIGLTDQEAGLR